MTLAAGEPIHAWLDELGHKEAAVREEARTKLLGLKAVDLPELVKIVNQSRPLIPSQTAVLREVVTHVYLTGRPYDADRGKGFLGVQMRDTTLPAGDEAASAVRPGVCIDKRMPGFTGFAKLRDGDILLSIADPIRRSVQGGESFRQAILRLSAGQTIQLEVLRQGKIVNLSLTLDPRPVELERERSIESLLQQREMEAQAYWAADVRAAD